jgi:uncharacterized protein (DUF983 family)
MLLSRILAILAQRCPVCLQGQVFHSLLGMNKDCPVCGVHFERETGYFLNSMFVGYVGGFLLLIPSAIWLYVLGVSVPIFSLLIVLEMAILWPLIFRYARIIWLHIDQVLDPRSPVVTPGAKQGQ